MDNDLESKLLADIDKNLSILLSHYVSVFKEQKQDFSTLRRSNLRKNSSSYLAAGSFYNYKQTDKKLKMLSGMKYTLNELKKLKYVK